MRDRDIEPDEDFYTCPGCGDPMTEAEVERTPFTTDTGGAELLYFHNNECFESWLAERGEDDT